jgi:hypothetical protein
MGEIARKAREELLRNAETRGPNAVYLEETREDFYRRVEDLLRNALPGFDPFEEEPGGRPIRPLKRRPVDRHRARPVDLREDAPPCDYEASGQSR